VAKKTIEKFLARADPEMTRQLIETGNRDYLQAEKVIELAHGRGKSELTNRSFKEFIGREQLPFKNFGMNGAYYYVLDFAAKVVKEANRIKLLVTQAIWNWCKVETLWNLCNNPIPLPDV
jgi:hypothetical protein